MANTLGEDMKELSKNEEYNMALNFYEIACSDIITKSELTKKLGSLCANIIGLNQLNRLEAARKDVDIALKLIKSENNQLLTPFKAILNAQKGNIFLKEEKYKKAVIKLKQAVQDAKNSKISNEILTQIRSDLAKAHMEQRDYEKAEIVLLQSLQVQLENLRSSDDLSKDLSDFNLTPSQAPEDNVLESLLDNLEDSLCKRSNKKFKIALLYDTIGCIFYLHYRYKLAVKSYDKANMIKSNTLKRSKYTSTWNRLASAEYLSKAYFAWAEIDSEKLEEAAKYYGIRVRIMKTKKNLITRYCLPDYVT